MRETEQKNYNKLNELAEAGGIVVFGNGDDKLLPLGELRQAFAIEPKLYNRSFTDLSVTDAVKVYQESVVPLAPETVLLHLGDADIDFFSENSTAFDNKYMELIRYIKVQNKESRIAVISLRNYEKDLKIAEINKHLKNIAASEQCEYGDIANKLVWNPKSTQETASFVHSIGFVRPLKTKRPLYDLVKMIFGVWE